MATGSSNARNARNLASSDGPVQTGRVEIGIDGTAQLPEMDGQYVSFKAGPDNEDIAYMHGVDSEDGWPLDAGEETGLKPVSGAHRYEFSGTEGDSIYFELIP